MSNESKNTAKETEMGREKKNGEFDESNLGVGESDGVTSGVADGGADSGADGGADGGVIGQKHVAHFRNALGGYNKKDVTSYLQELQSTVDATVTSYEEKLDQMRNSNIMLSHEIESIRRENEKMQAECAQMAARMKEIEVGADKYDEAIVENDSLKQRLLEADDASAKAGELEVVCTHLKSQLEISESNLSSAETRIRALENSVTGLSRTLADRDHKNSITTAQLIADRKLSDDRRHIAVEKLRVTLASLTEGIMALDPEKK